MAALTEQSRNDSSPVDPALVTCTGAAIDTLAVRSARQTGLRPTTRRVIRDFETNRPAFPRD